MSKPNAGVFRARNRKWGLREQLETWHEHEAKAIAAARRAEGYRVRVTHAAR